MRQKHELVLSFASHDEELPKTVREHRARYKGISAALDLMPEILDLVHRDPGVTRTDTTVVECNIHWPTDSSLLWEVWRVASRILRRVGDLDPAAVPRRFHDRKVNGLHLTMTRYVQRPATSRQRLVKQTFRKLIQRVAWIVETAEELC